MQQTLNAVSKQSLETPEAKNQRRDCPPNPDEKSKPFEKASNGR